ncbi:Hypothetical protein MVR_LOCUS44 [uncultured virus]|nr:Hypothetical protein MVR_LOCUS44 [uncultured virus]
MGWELGDAPCLEQALIVLDEITEAMTCELQWDVRLHCSKGKDVRKEMVVEIGDVHDE